MKGKTGEKGRHGRKVSTYWTSVKETGRYWKFKGEAINRTAWKTRHARCYGRVARQINWK
jgi:hypothetical protein